jgi:hypothetical protein
MGYALLWALVALSGVPFLYLPQSTLHGPWGMGWALVTLGAVTQPPWIELRRMREAQRDALDAPAKSNLLNRAPLSWLDNPIAQVLPDAEADVLPAVREARRNLRIAVAVLLGSAALLMMRPPG